MSSFYPTSRGFDPLPKSFYSSPKGFYSSPKRMFADAVQDDGPDVLAVLAESQAVAQRSDSSAWVQISSPKKSTPAGSRTVPLGSQRAFKRTVSESDATLPSVFKGKPFDAGLIGANSGRIVILGQLGANDLQDTYKITLSSPGALNLFAPNPDYNPDKAGSKISLGDAQVELFDASGKLVATSDTRNGAGFSNWISLSTEGLGGLKLDRGSYIVKITRDNPVSHVALAVTSKGELNFDKTVLDDNAKVGTTVSAPPVTIKNSDGIGYVATYQLVKKAEGGPVPDTTPDPAAAEGRVGGPDDWEVQLVGLKPVKQGDPAPVSEPSGSAPIKLGVFKIYAASSSGVASPAEYASADPAVTFDDGSTLAFTASSVLAGNLKISADGAHTVANTDKVSYSLFAAIGDPGAVTFYTVKETPLSAAEKRKADAAAAVAAAKAAAKSGSSGLILSLFS